MTTVITFIIVLGFLISVHELGHFCAAKAVGVKVEEFSIGFPPKVVSKSFGGTRYTLSWIPLGGYVRLRGQNIEDENPDEEGNYAAKSSSQKFAILIAGAAMNLLVALIFAPLALYIGQEVPAVLYDPPVVDTVAPDSAAQNAGIKAQDRIIAVNRQPVANWHETQKALISLQNGTALLTVVREGTEIDLRFDAALPNNEKGFGWSYFMRPVIGSVLENSPAARAGLRSGDVLVRIDSAPIGSWSEITSAVSKSNGRKIDIQLLRGEVRHTISLTPFRDREYSRWIIGVNSPTVRVSENLPNALGNGVVWVGHVMRATYEFLYKMVVGQAGSESIGGPIAIAQMVGNAAERGVADLLHLVGFISLQLSIFNLLPIPALDGGHLFFLAIEKIKGSSLSRRFRVGMQKLGFILLTTLIILVLIQDGYRVFANL